MVLADHNPVMLKLAGDHSTIDNTMSNIEITHRFINALKAVDEAGGT